ncbi:MAG TPA: hypothetical protein VE222_08240, partial [Nitrospiraceae bacterium]|nr:hypothetical protein [Nitrospiraceae bacterium]
NLAHRHYGVLISRLPDCNFEMPHVFRTQQDSPTREGALMRPWMRAVFEVAIMAATMCSGSSLANTTCLWGIMKGTKEGGILGRTNGIWTAQRNKRFTMDWKNRAKRLLGNRTIHLEGDGQFAFRYVRGLWCD